MTEPRTDWRAIGIGWLAFFAMGAGLAALANGKACAQEGNLVTLVLARNAEQTWGRAAVVVPGPAWGPPLRQAAPEPPQPRQSPVQKIIDESDRCIVAWHSRRGRRASKITCWAKR